MAPRSLQRRRTHNLLLISKLLSQKESASPFTLIIDSLEQSGQPLIREYIKRANTARNQVIFVSYQTLRKPRGADIFVPAWREGFATVQRQIVAHLSASPTQRKVVIFDSLNTLCSDPMISSNLPAALSSFISPTVSLLALYHADIPIATSILQSAPYSPQPLTVLRYLATTIMTTHSIHHVLSRKAARDRSVAEPVFGLEEDIEGILVGLGGNGPEGLVLEMEYRRKSGRGVREWYFLPHPSIKPATSSQQTSSGGNVSRFRETVILLEDQPLYRRPEEENGKGAAEDDGMDVTFELGLTEKQRRDREGVVLPYFDAQKGGGEGGRILYDMGVEDDFDEEEDEI
ncbi:hypothetical protein AAFC00_005101 [Neodothiora populina]|uniref:Elongator complex protein 5 n=1 Tax=Neodothiora populina TaxID=2781224 RepID=A0ABR3PK71_9PEZI